jgi:glycosyltransferase involved in cell wall biosynthesis
MCPYAHQYQYLPTNIGATGGRNVGYQMAKGRFVYFMDDDAYIEGPKDSFFQPMLSYLEQNENAFCTTTSIFDIGLNDYRSVPLSKSSDKNNRRKALMFHGGSFLIDKNKVSINENLFLENQFFGMEELYTAYKKYFQSKYITYFSDLNVIHDPGESARYFTKASILNHCVNTMQTKLIFYPLIGYPFISASFYFRIMKYLGIGEVLAAHKSLLKKTKNMTKETTTVKMFFSLLKEFGLRGVL